MATDQEIRDRGIKFLPLQKYLQSDYQFNEPVEEEVTESFGIPQTQAFTNSGRGGGIQGLDPYNRPQGKPLDPNSFLGKTFGGLKNFGGTVVDKFYGLPGIKQGGEFIKNIMDNTMIGRFAAMRNPLNPNAGNYNRNLQGQIDYLSGLSVDDKMYIGRDPNSGLSKYGPDSVLSGQNVVSAFGTNDYKSQLQKNLERLQGYGKNVGPGQPIYKPATLKAIEKTEKEIAALEEDEEDKIKKIVNAYKRPGVKDMFEEVYDGKNIHGGPTQIPPGGYNSPENYGAQGLQRSGNYGGNDTYSGQGSTVDSGGNVTGSQGQDLGNINDEFARDGGRVGYFFGGRVNYKAGGRINFRGGGMDMGNQSNQEQSAAMGGGATDNFSTDNNNPPVNNFDYGGNKLLKQYKEQPNYTLGEIELNKNLTNNIKLNSILDLQKTLEDEELTGRLKLNNNLGPIDTNFTYGTNQKPQLNVSYINNNPTFGSIDVNADSSDGLGVNYGYDNMGANVNFDNSGKFERAGVTYDNNGLALGLDTQTGASANFSRDIFDGKGKITAGGTYNPDGIYNVEGKISFPFANGGLASIL